MRLSTLPTLPASAAETPVPAKARPKPAINKFLSIKFLI